MGHKEESYDPISRKEIEANERALMYVAATRARKALYVLFHGKPSRLLKNILVNELQMMKIF